MILFTEFLILGGCMSKKSFIAKIEELILNFTKPDYMDSKEKLDEFLSKRQSNGKPVKSIFKSIYSHGMQVFAFGDEKSENTIVYIHGGAYINEINYQHLLYCFLLSHKLDAYVLAPVYPLAPMHSADETFELMVEFYKNLISSEDNLILMGDSAGGGFVLSFCQYIKTIDLTQPNEIIVFSPWVDIGLSNPPYDNETDPILGEVGLREIGKIWAGNWNLKDYRVSPTFGDNKDLPKTLIFAGDNEIFYKDIVFYVKKLKEDSVDVKLVVGEGMFHIYPLFPSPEARAAFKIIKEEFNNLK